MVSPDPGNYQVIPPTPEEQFSHFPEDTEQRFEPRIVIGHIADGQLHPNTVLPLNQTEVEI